MGKPLHRLDTSALMRAMISDDPAQGNALAISPDGRMHISGFTLAATGIAEVDPNVSSEQFEQFGQVLRNVNKALQFAIGDFCNLAALRYGDDRRTQLADWFGIELTSLYEYCRVSNAVQFSIRIENLTFGHHQVVAAMDAAEQVRWLEQAEANRWSVAALKRAIKKARLPGGKSDDKPVLTPQMLQAKTDGAYVQNETQWPGWEQSDAIRHEVKIRAGRLVAYYSELYKRLK